MKIETLEEAAEKYLLSSVERNQYGDELSFIDGAKWQQERNKKQTEFTKKAVEFYLKKLNESKEDYFNTI